MKLQVLAGMGLAAIGLAGATTLGALHDFTSGEVLSVYTLVLGAGGATAAAHAIGNVLAGGGSSTPTDTTNAARQQA